jgi:hypothetical protein
MHLSLSIGPYSLYVVLGRHSGDDEDEPVEVSDGDLESDLADQGDHPNAEMHRTAGFEAC